MGQSSSAPEKQEISVEQASHEIALRFAQHCFSHLEIAHYKDNFKTLADHQDGIEYWKEETLCRFLCIPSTLHAGPVVFQVANYLGSFPFPSLAPCILTREAMLKVVTIMTERYTKVLKRGRHDKNKLLFRSMAVFDRRNSALSPVTDKASLGKHSSPMNPLSPIDAEPKSRGYAVDQPTNDGEEEEDDDDLALAALDALDAFEVFQEDQKKERKLSQARIPVENLKRLLELLLLVTPATSQDNLAMFGIALDAAKRQILADTANAMAAAFHPENSTQGVRYNEFVQTLNLTLPNVFRPLTPLFEHFLFSKNIDLAKHTGPPVEPVGAEKSVPFSPINRHVKEPESDILNDIVLAQIAASLELGPTVNASTSSIFNGSVKLNPLYSIASHGTSLSSFSRQVLSWPSASLILASGISTDTGKRITIGAHLPTKWKDGGVAPSPEHVKTATMFQLQPVHAVFRANPHNHSIPLSHFSSKAGISLGCVVPPVSRIEAQHQKPIPGPVSLIIDADIFNATFYHDPEAGTGAFVTDPRLEELQQGNIDFIDKAPSRKTPFEIDALEVWGISLSGDDGDPIIRQQRHLAWEEAEAERRRGVGFDGDPEGARRFLEMAGIVGEDAQSRSGGSV